MCRKLSKSTLHKIQHSLLLIKEYQSNLSKSSEVRRYWKCKKERVNIQLYNQSFGFICHCLLLAIGSNTVSSPLLTIFFIRIIVYQSWIWVSVLLLTSLLHNYKVTYVLKFICGVINSNNSINNINLTQL